MPGEKPAWKTSQDLKQHLRGFYGCVSGVVVPNQEGFCPSGQLVKFGDVFVVTAGQGGGYWHFVGYKTVYCLGWPRNKGHT